MIKTTGMYIRASRKEEINLTGFLYGIAGTLGTVISIGAVVYLCFYILKHGFKLPAILGLFAIFSVLAYLINEPSKIQEFGGYLIQTADSIRKGKM